MASISKYLKADLHALWVTLQILENVFGYEGRDWIRAGEGDDTIDGGPGIDDLHGGNGRDDIIMTNGDRVRGGAGLDLCKITTGQPALIKSCGVNEREQPRLA